MTAAQIVAVTTTEIGPSGPVRKLFAVGVAEVDVAVEEVTKRLKPGETARWVDARFLTLRPGEVRQL